MPDQHLPVFNIWSILVVAVPSVIAIIVGTFQVIRVLKSEIRSELGPIMTELGEMEQRVTIGFRGLWEHNATQDARIETVTAAHNRLEGAHDAIIKMGVHGVNCDRER